MEPSKLIHDATKVHACLEELSDGRLVAKKACKIVIPVRFAERGLAYIGIETTIVGIYAIVVDDLYYGVSMVNAMIRIEPTSTVKITIDEEEYYEFSFDAGSTIMPSLQLVKNDMLVYKIYDEIISKAHVPWYLTYDLIGKIFDTAKTYGGADVGENREVTELIVSITARDRKDRHKYYRASIKGMDDLKKNPPAFVPMRSVIFAATNTVNKLAGSYFNEGLVSALVSPTTRVERLDRLLTT